MPLRSVSSANIVRQWIRADIRKSDPILQIHPDPSYERTANGHPSTPNSGNRISNRSPLCSRLAARMLPWCATTARSAMASPSPTLPERRVRAASERALSESIERLEHLRQAGGPPVPRAQVETPTRPGVPCPLRAFFAKQ